MDKTAAVLAELDDDMIISLYTHACETGHEPAADALEAEISHRGIYGRKASPPVNHIPGSACNVVRLTDHDYAWCRTHHIGVGISDDAAVTGSHAAGPQCPPSARGWCQCDSYAAVVGADTAVGVCAHCRRGIYFTAEGEWLSFVTSVSLCTNSADGKHTKQGM